MKFIDMFSGIGGFRSALELSGHECIAYSEIDKYAKQSYQAIYDTENEIDLGDITEISQEYLSRFKEENDIVVGGSPCFRKGTLITTKNGLKPIEEIKKGDIVLTHNNRYKKVVVPMVNPAKEIYSLKVEKNVETFVTPEHPIRVRVDKENEAKWVKVKDLDKNKHYIQLGSFEYSHIEELELLSTDETVYNFEVEDDNSYVANNMVVHNCQSFSLAGDRKGFEDTRGTLFFEYAKVVKETQPKYFLFENVKGMLSHDKGNTIRVVLETFNELGYYIDFNVFNSKYYDVPQNRERIYIVGKRKDLVEQPKYHDKTKGKKKFDEIHNWAVDNINYVELLPPLQTEVTTRLVDVLEDEVDEKYYLSDEKVEKLTLDNDLGGKLNVNYTYPTSKTRRGRVGKQVAQKLQAGEVNQGVVMEDKGIRFTEDGFHTHRNDKKKSSIQGTHVTYKEGKTHALTSNHVPMTLQAGEVNQGVVIDDTQGYDGVRYYKGIAPTLRSSRSGLKTIVTPKEETGETNQGVVINPLKNKTDYGWHFEQAVYDSQGITRTVKANGGSGNIPKTIEGLRIRKLTPLECWRLQGFTDEQFYKAKDSGVSNSQLYKQAGNAVTVNVVDAIVKELK